MSGYFQMFSALSQGTTYVVALGDSRTAAKNGMWNYQPVVNIAVDGATTDSLISDQLPQLVQLMPNASAVFIDIGINDVAKIVEGQETIEHFQTNAETIVTSILQSGAVTPTQLFISNTTPIAGNDQSQFYSWFDTTLAVASAWEGLCTTHGCHLIDMLGAFTGGSNLLADVSPALYIPGGGHYSAGGWMLVNKTVTNALANA